MTDKNLGEQLDNIENLRNKEFKVFGLKATPTTAIAAITAVGSLLGMLYGGFVTYQKVEAISEIDPGAIFSELDKVNARINEAEKDTKGLKEDIKRAEATADDAYRFVKDVNKDMNDELRAFRKDVKEIEDSFTNKLQKALNNPLSDM
jgi:septal ring factor EnvC (AmiA/AmiB activator)